MESVIAVHGIQHTFSIDKMRIKVDKGISFCIVAERNISFALSMATVLPVCPVNNPNTSLTGKILWIYSW
jgi:hypothetical protein